MATEPAPQPRPICCYEGSAYRTEFWGSGRDYEDAAERLAISHLLPPRGRRLVEIGAGYGRLAPLYSGYDEVVFFDYALSQLRQAQALWGECGSGGQPGYRYVAGSFYALPFAPRLFDTVTMVRTIHHAADVPAVLKEVAQILASDGVFLLEFANKRHLKSILRYVLRLQRWSPFDQRPYEFAELNFDFHPAWMRRQLAEAGLEIQKVRAVSYFRLDWLKRALPLGLLVALERVSQPTGRWCQLSPSIFVLCQAVNRQLPATTDAFFRCIVCSSVTLRERGEAIECVDCGARFAIRDGIYDFRAPLAEE
ncbi:MAG: methyltransferase domain-containing protein [Anaerolineae bacterium]|nr:methyltransferase domain-containing protein [Anaerolineae bacterium]